MVYHFFLSLNGRGWGGRFPGIDFVPGLDLNLNISSQKQSKLV